MNKQFAMLVLMLACAVPAQASMRIFACEPEWGALASELAPPDADIFVATTAQQDPHYIQARPSLLARIRRADLLVCNGADLEIGWLPQLLQRAGNPRVQPGQPGYFLAAEQVTLLDIPTRIDRSEGDIHPNGNPHLHLDPARIRQVAVALVERLRAVQPEAADAHAGRLRDFLQRWDAAYETWQQRARGLQGLPVVVVHSEWRYLAHWTGLRVVARIEARPGIPPSVSHLAEVLRRIETDPPRAVLLAPGRSTRGADWLRERSGLRLQVLPYTVGGSPGAGNLFTLFDETLKLLEALAQ